MTLVKLSLPTRTHPNHIWIYTLYAPMRHIPKDLLHIKRVIYLDDVNNCDELSLRSWT